LFAQQAKTEGLHRKADSAEAFRIGQGGVSCLSEAVSVMQALLRQEFSEL
jgi:hypothetical protein